jgi:hypothetical protein
VIAGEDLAVFLGIEPRCKLGGAHQIAEHHGQLTALAERRQRAALSLLRRQTTRFTGRRRIRARLCERRNRTLLCQLRWHTALSVLFWACSGWIAPAMTGGTDRSLRHPNQHASVLVARHAARHDQLFLDVFQIVVVELEATLDRAIRRPTITFQDALNFLQ